MSSKPYLLTLLFGVFLNIARTNGILNGVPSDNTEYRYHVTLMRVRKDIPIVACGGAIITRWHVLTAAHCVNELQQQRREDLIVRHSAVGQSNLNNQTETIRSFHRVAKVYLPNRYSGSPCRRHHNDIAILKVSQPFDLANSSVYAKVNLPEFDNDYEGYDATVTGHGPDYSPGQNDASDEIKTVQYVSEMRAMPAKVIPNEECQETADVVLTGGSICVKPVDPTSRTCYEDDGGPLVHDGTVIGILNDRKCSAFTPELFTRVSSYLDFIKAVLDHEITYDIRVY